MSKQKRKPRAQSKSPPRRQQVVEDITLPAISSSVSMSTRVIRAAHTKWGSREMWGPVQFVHAELCAIFPDGPPPIIKGHAKALVEDINDRLVGKLMKADNGLLVAKPGYLGNAGYKAKYGNARVDHQTVARALKKWRADNG